MRRRLVLAALAAAALVAVLGYAVVPSGAQRQTSKRTIYLTAAEWKGSTNVSSEQFPARQLPAGGGYLLTAPNDAGQWGVSTYRFDSASVHAVEGELVTLRILGVNGASHEITIPGLRRSFTVTRGRITTDTFRARRPGIYRMICNTHQPSMVTDVVVHPRS